MFKVISIYYVSKDVSASELLAVNKCVRFSTFPAIKLTNIKNNSGQGTKPWGTPTLTISIYLEHIRTNIYIFNVI